MAELRIAKRIRKIALIGALACIIAVAIMLTMAMTAEAKGKTGIVTDSRGNTYILKDGHKRTGWIRYKGNYYYAHRTATKAYPKGSVAKNTYRVRGHRMYYFGADGKRQTKNSRYIALNKASGSVHYVYHPGLIRRYRYNANHKRYQWLEDDGTWSDVGMQCWPTGWIDWQE